MTGGPGLAAFAGIVATFHITDRTMLRAQRTFESALAAGAPSEPVIRAYLAAVKHYFTGFDRDARAQLASVDRELERLYVRQYNLTAERGVAAKRVEAVQGVLTQLAELARP